MAKVETLKRQLEKLEDARVSLNKAGANSRSSIVSKQRRRCDLDEKIQRLRGAIKAADSESHQPSFGEMLWNTQDRPVPWRDLNEPYQRGFNDAATELRRGRISLNAGDRKRFACRTCSNEPNEDGVLVHHQDCTAVLGEIGGTSFIELQSFIG